MIIDDLRNALNDARRAKDNIRVSTFSHIIGEMSSNAKMINGVKTVSDDDAIAYLKKYVKNCNETLQYAPNVTISLQKALAEGYIPEQMSKEEIIETIEKCKNLGLNDMRSIMSYFKETLKGRYDASLVSVLVKENV